MASVFGRAASVILGLVVIASSPSSAVGQDGAPDSGASARECAAPLLDTTLFGGAFLEAVRSLSPAEAWAVGGRAIGRGAREALILRYDGIDWREELLPMPLVGDSAFMSVDASGPRAHPWAVGYIRGPRSLAPLVARFADGGWVVDTALDAEEAGAVLVDVAATDDGAAWAVGFTLQEPGEQRPWVIRLTGEGFTAAPPPLGSDERGALSSVSATDEGDVWVVGTVTRGGTMVPYIARNAADGWVRQPLPDVGQGSLADISMPGPQQGWAVGHMLDGGSIRPLVLHWDGDSWAEVAAPETASSAMLLSGVSDPGVATVVGSEWDEQRQDLSLTSTTKVRPHCKLSKPRLTWGDLTHPSSTVG